MNKFNWGMDLLYKPSTLGQVSYNIDTSSIYVVDVESALAKMTEYKEAKEVINEILESLGKGTR